MNQENFIYNEKNKQYEAKINNIDFTLDKVPTENELNYIDKIAKNYNQELNKICNYMLQDNDFKEFFKCENMSEQELTEKLNMPIIRIITEDYASISYCNHTLDNMHMISFEFKGVFEKMAYLSIDG